MPLCLVVERSLVSLQTNTVMSAINFNQLQFFLVANLLTGLVNLSFNTLDMPAAPAILIMGSYFYLLFLLFAFLEHKRIKI